MLLPLLASCAGGSSASRADPADGQTVERRAVLSTGIDAKWIEVGDPRGAPVLFLHGYTDTSRSFLPTLHALTTLRPELRLIALDQRGHGGSSLPADDGCPAAPERCFEAARLAADALALLDREGIERAHLVGHSMGSVVAQEIALTHPGRIDRLVLIGTSSRMAGSPILKDMMSDGLVEGAWKKAVEARGLRFPADAWAMSPRDLDPQIETWLAANWVAEPGADPAHVAAIVPETASVPLGTWIGALRMQLAHDGRERLAALRAPTLVLFPIQDMFFQEDPDQRDLRAALQRASATHGTKWFWKRYGRRAPGEGPQNDLGHNLHWAAPGPVARDLAAFLRPDGAPTADLAFLEGGEAPRLAVEAGGALVLGPEAR
ncbi:MAG TPA: alpha/beta hydrolase [Planctomycetota bacterium]